MSEVATPTKERPILFNGEMVRAILDGRKTQTRRIMKPQPIEDWSVPTEGPDWYTPGIRDKEGELQPAKNDVYGVWTYDGEHGWGSPYGAPGDELWVRETWDVVRIEDEYLPSLCFRADGTAIPSSFKKVWDLLRSDDSREHKWRPSIHMPRWASRLQLRITDVRVERLQEIHELDAEEEGITGDFDQKLPSEYFKDLWNSINDKRGFGWDVNPWVWVVDFEVIRP